MWRTHMRARVFRRRRGIVASCTRIGTSTAAQPIPTPDCNGSWLKERQRGHRERRERSGERTMQGTRGRIREHTDGRVRAGLFLCCVLCGPPFR